MSEQSEPETQQEAQATPPSPSIRAFDQFGREILVPRDKWSANVLPGMIRESWDDPDQLYGIILSSLNDGFVPEVSEAAAHLYEIDTNPARGACMWGILLMQQGRMDEAEQVLAGYGANHPEDGSVLVNLAKVYASRDDMAKAEATLWHGLELEPNMENGVGWYAAIHAERAATEGGEQAGARAGHDALVRIASLPGSWRAQLWIAREALAAGNLPAARALYAESLSRVPRPVPPELLMQMSGDLGAGGFLQDLISLTAPEFQPNFHGLPVGNNLIKAYADTGNLGAAEAIKNALYAQARPDWKETLGFWDGELARRKVAATGTGTTVPPEVQIGMLRIDGAIWLPTTSPARVLFGERTKPGPTVSFLGGTAESPEAPTEPQVQMADALGRLSRSLPLFLAEQVEMRTAAQGRAVLPWAAGQAAGQRSGFVVSGTRWPAETAVQMVSGDPANQTDYVVTVHLDAEVEPWTADLVFLRTSDGVKIGELEAEFNPADASAALLGLADEVIDLVSALGPAATPLAYQLPGTDAFGAYLLRLEQLLAVRCAAMSGPAPLTLSGEREILDGDLELCLHSPGSIPARLLLIETLGTLARLRPEIAQEFAPKFQRLLLELPIPAIDEAYARATPQVQV